MGDDLRDLIERKRDGHALEPAEIERFVAAAANGTAPEVQLASMLMAILLQGMSDEERTHYALSMMKSGEILNWDHLDRPTVDKHSTGGVGDKVSLIWAPLMASVGFAVPMISGRGLGHTGGTLDKLEAIPGFRTDLSSEEMAAAVGQVGAVITGQTQDLVPADRSLYGLRSRTATVPSVDHIAPSILSKKLAEGASTLVLDVKVGRGAFMKTQADAQHLAEVMVAIGRGAGRQMAALLTTMDRPLGRAVGNAVEVRESLDVLRGGGPSDLRQLVVALAEAAVRASGHQPAGTDGNEGLGSLLRRQLENGEAYRSFCAMVDAQGGSVDSLEGEGTLRGEGQVETCEVPARRSGFVAAQDALEIGRAAAALGGGRGSDGEAPLPGVGVILLAKPGEAVEAGRPWALLHHCQGRGLSEAQALLEAALVIDEEACTPAPLILGRISEGGS